MLRQSQRYDMLCRTLHMHRSFLPISIAIFLSFVVFLSFNTRLLSLPPEAFRNHHSQSLLSETTLSPPTPVITPTNVLPFTFSTGHRIPPKIWQILFPHPNSPVDVPFDPQVLVDTPSWLTLNPGYSYILVGQREADYFINTHFSADAKLLSAWEAITNPGVKSDLLRYLMLYIEGGVYTDIDTEALKPIDTWVPEKYRDRAKVIIGIEWDQLDGGAWAEIPHRLQFCQWTIAAAPGHPLFMKMAYHTIDRLEELATEHQTTLMDLELSSAEVLTSSGPSSWTDIVLQHIIGMDPDITDVTDFSGMKPTGPRLHEDILILTIDGFGMGQTHSNSTHDGTIPEAALLKHKFRGSWRSGG
ncbi:hypothetical protein F5Y18DRAFT_386538 [Xylariaceae sp. FL1019]|nr:hypothetical protein F5Y18DRAFT_386538 [Xylariaceae sp. FL1019]